MIVYTAVSLRTPPMDQDRVAAVCWGHPFGFLKGKLASAGDPRLVALALFCLVAALYWKMH
jgi:hypothetical protein